MRPVYTALLALGLTIVTAAAQAATNDRIAEVDAIFTSWDKTNSPGCALGVIKDGTLTYARGYGLANLEHGVPITALTVFDIGSCSKQFTAFSILLLAQRDKLSLDDDIRKLVPEIPDYGTRITLRHLLHHTSGLRDYNDLLEMDGKHVEDLTTDDDALRLLAKQRALNFKPGDRHLYSNTGYFLLAIAVKRASGQSLRVFALQNIFRPLRMTNTHFHDDHTLIVPSRATGYGPRDDEGGFKIDMSNWEQLGDGAVMTTVEDLLKWDQNFYDAKVGGRELLDLMQTPGRLNGDYKLNYACGLMTGEYEGTPMIHHGGAWAGYRAELMRFPSEHLSIVLLANLGSIDAFDLAGQVALLQLKSKSSQPTKPVTAEEKTKRDTPRESARFAGIYRDADGRIAKVLWRQDHLVFAAGDVERELEPNDERSFIMRSSTKPSVTFSPSRKPTEKEMTLVREGRPPDIWRGVGEVPADLKLSEYTGVYRSEELNVPYTLRESENHLTVQVGEGNVYPLTAAFEDGFATDRGGTLVFSRKKRGRVTGFVLGSYRAHGLIFEKAK